MGDTGTITVDAIQFILNKKDALYIGKDVTEVIFEKAGKGVPLFYFNSAPAHKAYPTKKVTLDEAETVEMGQAHTANQRTIRKLLVNSVLPTCRL